MMPSNGKWIHAGKVSDFREGVGILLEAEKNKIALFESGGKFYAIDNLCPHKGAPLAHGHVEDCRLTCSWHAWEFDLKTGECFTLPEAAVKTYPVKIEGGEIYVKA